ncbi:MAG: motif putative anchor domain protein [Fibrobacteres bacterium]|nr:motif putative anchor domain protein [Fibrobacterota bacterium]
MNIKRAFPSISTLLLLAGAAQATPVLIATGTLDGTTDKSGLTGALESGAAANTLGGIGSGLAWAGGNNFIAIPDRGPNATPYAGGAVIDNTQSFIARFNSLQLTLDATPSGSLPFTLTTSLTGTTLLSSPTPLFYGSTVGLPGGAPAENTAGTYYFTGRSDGFGPGSSTNPNDARLDPEGVRVSNDGQSVFIADEYGPYVYQFDRDTGKRIRTFDLPDHFDIANLSGLGATEISGNTTGRVTNKGMEGLAISPDGKTLIGFMQSPLIQDGGDGGRANRIVTIDIATGATHEYAYDNKIGSKNFNSSEILALNDHQFVVLERDGKGLGDGSKAVVKQLWAVDLTGAQDVSTLQGESALLAVAPTKTLFLDIEGALLAFGLKDTQIPAKLEGLAFGQDVTIDGVVNHTLFVSNDNDFIPGVAGPSQFYAFGFTDADLAGMNLSFVRQEVVPEPQSVVLMAIGLGLLVLAVRRRRII